MQDNEKLYAILVERADGEQIAFIPDEEGDWSVSAWRRNPGQDETRWTEVVTAEVAEDEEPFWDDSHADLARGPVAVLVSESDQEQIARNGRSKPLLQKLVRALDKVDGLNGLSAMTTYPMLRSMVQNQRGLATFEVDGRRAKSDQPVEDAQEESLEAKEALQEQHGFLKEYKHRHIEGVEDFDLLDYALENRENVLLYGPTQSGKELAYGTPVLTPDGWVNIEGLNTGDEVIGSNGRPTKVYGVYDQGVKPIWKLTFSDGSSVRAGAWHQWRVRNKKGVWSTRTTRDLLEARDNGAELGRFVIPTVKPVAHPTRQVAIPPYMLGALLSDGSLHGHSIQWTKNSPEVAATMVKAAAKGGFVVRETTGEASTARQWRFSHDGDRPHASVLNSELAFLGLRVKSSEKFIPQAYLTASVDQRVDLLHGLFDGDGSLTGYGQAKYTSTSERLVDDVLQLLWSLGIPARKHAKRKRDKTWSVGILGDFDPFLASEHHGKVTSKAKNSQLERHIVSIEPDGEDQARCIAVTAEDSLYVTKDYIVTHNTTLPIAYAEHKGLPVFLLACNVALEPSQIFGKFIPDEDGGFLWCDGPLTKLVRNGGVLVIDEANVASPKIMTTLYPLLDSRREISLLDHEGEVIRAHKDLLIVATCNLGYQGTLPMSEAFLDRFAHRHHWDYSAEVEDKLVKSETLLKMARQIRKEGDIRSPFSTSLLKAFERLATSKLGWDYAVGNLLGRFTDAEDREAVNALLDLRTQKIKEELGLVEVPKPVRSEDIPEHPKTSREWREVMSTWS